MAGRRGKGEGSISQRDDGQWVGRIDMGHDANGKRIRKVVYGATKKACADKLTKLQGQRLDGTYVDTGRVTVADLLDRWLSDDAAMKCAANTTTRYKGVCDLHIKPRIGSMPLAKLKPLHISGMLADMTRDEVGVRTQGHCFAVCRRAFNVGMKWGLVLRNPCNAVTAPKYQRKDINPLTVEQAVATMKASEDSGYYALFVLSITSGLRQGEIFGLQWPDLDLKKGELTVTHSLEEVKGKVKLKETKSRSGRRRIMLSEVAVSALRDHQRDMLAAGLIATGIVFPSPEGTWMRKSNFTRRVWFPIREAAGLPKTMTFHGLRHSAATLLLAEDVSIKVIQEMMGHAKISTTLDNYGHVMKNMQQQAATTFDKLFRPKTG